MSPFLILSISAAVILVIGLLMLLLPSKAKGLIPVGFWIRRLVGLCVVVGGLGVVAIAISVYQYAKLAEDVPVASLSVQQRGPQTYLISLRRADGKRAEYQIYGDEWQLDARVVRWRMAAWLMGAPPLFRLERLSGRYRDSNQELKSPRSVHALDQPLLFDIHSLQKRFSTWMPFVDARFGSAAYMPMLDGAKFEVYYAPRGGLVAKAADPATGILLEKAGW